MKNNLDNLTKKAQDAKMHTQNVVYAQTVAALERRNVEKTCRDLGAGYSEIIYKIVGSETVGFKFHMSDYEKIAKVMTIIITVKNIRSEKTVKENFVDEEFVKQMLELFTKKEKQMLQKEKNKKQALFVKQLKAHLK